MGVTELYEPVADEKGFKMTVAVSPGLTITGNRELVGQAIANLIDNALKYGATDSSAGGRIDISARREDSRIVIEVGDHGAGIGNSDRQRVFDRFVRLEGARSRPGSGLGLSLAAAVARLHGGTVRLEDNAPGLKVVVTFPARDPALAPPPAQARAAE
jgi:signal transduction histidine kinase